MSMGVTGTSKQPCYLFFPRLGVLRDGTRAQGYLLGTAPWSAPDAIPNTQ